MEKQYRDEMLLLQKKYHGLQTPLYTKVRFISLLLLVQSLIRQQRFEIIHGDYEPTEEEAQREPDSDEEEDEEVAAGQEKKEETTAGPIKGIPEFWLTIFKNHPLIAEAVTERDEEALASLKNIRYEYLPDSHGFKLVFEFEENKFFTNTELTKTYYLNNSSTSGFDDVVFDRAEGTKIEWKQGENLCVTIETKKQRHKGTNKTRVVKKEVPADSFFNFFTPPAPPKDVESLDDDEVREIEELVEADFGVGEVFKDKLIPNAINW